MALKALAAIAFLFALSLCQRGHAEEVEIDSLRQLADYAGRSGYQVTMKPGTYQLADLIPLDSTAQRRRDKRYWYIDFSGSNNQFRLDGVEIIADTKIREALRPPVHSNEFLVSGNHNQIHGLTITNTGNGKSPGGALVSITGDDNTISHCQFTVRGSSPYGYGDLFGKGGPSVIGHLKHSGVQILGNRTRVLDCRLLVRSFGHGFFVQGGEGQHFENCYVEGEVRSTDEMLEETEGPAHRVNFQMVLKTRNGDHTVLPGYTKSKCEDGYRTYNAVKDLTLINCVAKNMRGGFELRTKGGGVHIQGCEAIGCERGFWVGNGAIIEESRGNIQFGPLLYLEGDGAKIDLTCDGKEPQSIVHALAAISGKDHRVILRTTSKDAEPSDVPILVGYSAPPAGEGMCFLSARSAANIVLENLTSSPVIVHQKAAANQIDSQAAIRYDDSPRR
ncbi:right-handed parallel beta-helix repeat-containing protein [Bremerella sp.]|uniref:right-handed parallel beta-helix repeat-containing protein n=1 Tax=Bremerella sp. TaxID=2795602 RepID=UPI00391C4F18